MNYPLVTVVVNNAAAFADKQICLHEGDANVVVKFKVVNPQYKLTKADEDDYLVLTGAAQYQIRIEKQDGTQQITGTTTSISDKQLSYTFNSAFTGEGRVGAYDYQITLLDSGGSAILTLPLIKGGIVVRERLF